MNLLVSIIVVALVASFLTQLLVHDRILDEPRERFYSWLQDHGKFGAYLYDGASCHRCVGVWMSLFSTPFVLAYFEVDITFISFLTTALAASYVSFWLMQHQDPQ